MEPNRTEGFAIPIGETIGTNENNDTTSHNASKDSHYDNVKKKYFQSLGMNGGPPPMKIRSYTENSPTQEPISPKRIRSVSQPISQPIVIGQTKPGASNPITMAVSIGSAKTITMFEEEEDEEKPVYSSSFVPPHEMMKYDSSAFTVGTAVSVSRWEREIKKNSNWIED